MNPHAHSSIFMTGKAVQATNGPFRRNPVCGPAVSLEGLDQGGILKSMTPVKLSAMALLPVLASFLGCAPGVTLKPLSQPELVQLLRKGGQVIYMRHPTADVGKDKPRAGAWWKECGEGHRMLSDKGRADAVLVGKAIQRLGIPVSEVRSSEYCRAVEAARLLGLGEPVTDARLNHLQARLEVEPDRGLEHLIRDTRLFLSTRADRGNVLLVSHKQEFPDSPYPVLAELQDGECAVFTPKGKGGFVLRGRIKVEDWAGFESIP
jgi:phosphohistidine phosphatase SixA